MGSRRTGRDFSSSSSWIWAHEERVVGVKLDIEKGLLHYYRHVGSLCGDDGSFAEQTIGAYLQRGALTVLGDVPDDVNRELREVLKAAGRIR